MQLEYGVIFVNFNPVTGTDYINTRIELEPSSSLADAIRKQSQLLATVSSKESYRCYIQERETYTVQLTRTKTRTSYKIKGIHNIKELTR